MAKCDSGEFITAAVKYTQAALPGVKQLAALAYVIAAFNGNGSSGSVKTAVTNARLKLSSVSQDQVMAGLTNILAAACIRSGTPINSAAEKQMQNYLTQLPDEVLWKIIANELCSVFSTLVP